MKILVAGIAGGLARQVAERLVEKGHTVAGLDKRPWPGAPSSIEVHTVDLRKRAAEALVDAVIGQEEIVDACDQGFAVTQHDALGRHLAREGGTRCNQGAARWHARDGESGRWTNGSRG